MELLPQSINEFREVSYWNRFFTDTAEAFEWYGDYTDIKPLLQQYLTKSDRVLNVGCGNSDVPIWMYDDGFHQLVNVDFSEVAIKAMQQKTGFTSSGPVGKAVPARPGLNFEVLDVRRDGLRKKFGDSSFDVVMDKGFLDAVLAEDVTADAVNCSEYFHGVMSILKPSGKFMVISLGQDYIIKQIVRYLYSKQGGHVCAVVHPFRIGRDSVLQPFLFLFTKSSDTTVSEFSSRCRVVGGNCWKSETFPAGQLQKIVSHIIQVRALRDAVQSFKPGRRFVVEVPGQNGNHIIAIYDNEKKHTSRPSTAALITPLGQEGSWMYTSEEGNQQLADAANAKRLLIISLAICTELSPDLTSEEATNHRVAVVNQQLSKHLDDLALPGSPSNMRIVALLDENAKGSEVIAKVHSKLSGTIVVRDLQYSGFNVRQLVFSTNPQCVQSEVEHKRSNGFDFLNLRSSYQQSIILSFGALCGDADCRTDPPPINVLLLGLGGGILASSILAFYDGWPIKITSVELDPEVVKLAKEYFGYETHQNSSCVVNDAVTFLNNVPTLQDVIIVDVSSGSSSSPITCPAPKFLDPLMLKLLTERLNTNGLLVFNLLTRSEKARETVHSRLLKLFPYLLHVAKEEDVNEVVICKKTTDAQLSAKNHLVAGLKQLLIRRQQWVRKSEKNARDVGFIEDIHKWEARVRELSLPENAL